MWKSKEMWKEQWTKMHTQKALLISSSLCLIGYETVVLIGGALDQFVAPNMQSSVAFGSKIRQGGLWNQTVHHHSRIEATRRILIIGTGQPDDHNNIYSSTYQ